MWFKKKTIFITDDSHAYLMHVSILLNKMGFHVVSGNGLVSGNELVSKVRAESPDLIILDVDISGTDGIGILKLLKEDPDLNGIPVAVISDDPSERTRRRCEDLSCSSYLMKPVSINDMHELLQQGIYAPMGYVRKNLRVIFPNSVYVSHKGVSHELKSETLSEKGIYVYTDTPLPVSSDVEVTLPLYDGKSISLKGCVIYKNMQPSAESGASKGMAVEFRETDSDKLMMISNYVTGLLTIPSEFSD